MTTFSEQAQRDFHALACDAQVNVLDVMLVLATALDDQADTEDCRARLDQIAAWVRPVVERADTEGDRIENFLVGMRELGFRGNTEHYYDARNTLIGEVLERRTGIPISLCIVFMEVAQRLGIELRPIGFPFHFLLAAARVPGLYLDPFFGTTRDTVSCAELLDQMSGGTVMLRNDFFAVVDARQVVVRVLRNLKQLHRNAGAIKAAYGYCDLILLFDPEQSVEYRDRGTLCLALGEWNRAMDDLSTYLAMNPHATDRPVVLGQLRWVLHQQASIH